MLSGTQSWAQSTVSLRSGVHDDYSRLVFDWPETASYKISKSKGTLSLSFDKVASINVTKVNAETLRNIGRVSVVSGQNDPLSVSIQIKDKSNFRHFKIGKRVVIDVYNAAGEITKLEPSQESQRPPPPSSIAQPSRTALKPTGDSDIEQIDIEQEQITGVEPHVITLTTTQNVGMAAFERAGFLWLVFDDPDLKVPPILAGPHKDKFAELEAIELPNATAYRMPKPEGYNIYGEGGGLLWRVVMTPNPRRTKPMKPETKHDGLSLNAGGTLTWPMLGVRKIITLRDPMVGDDIQVVIVDSSADFAGEKRQFVELETLPSFIGLALVSKIDDIRVSAALDGLVVTRPQGLALSPVRDTAPIVLKDDIQKEQETFEAEENPTRLTRMFDFNRWEMGGWKSLEENRRVIMVGLGNKQGHGKVEDLITLAKLNIANDRGQEALGLLRVAANELPGIEENAEFIALRGAAGALAGKYDEAIEDLAAKELASYGEIGYWKAFALAGLEDWRQADSVLPSDLSLLEKYPKQIKQPVALALGEAALRGGKTDLAEKLLMMLESEFPEMSPSRKSAWKYLNGELERQAGNIDQALENWGTLITGRDDYYRAKAGLSLTKLQLERKKITPAKAIDRLEGLRYAWRGDELETLINFRLGEVYIDNEDYLKGLSVLRNAVSLSPDSIMSTEVTDYMTQTFRSLFTDGKLKDVSPLDAVSIYDEFKELTPIGEEGDSFVQQLAERLVDVDLLGRASALLEHQLNHRLKGLAAARVAIRLAAIRLLDNKAEGALRSLEVAENSLKVALAEGPQDLTSERREIKLLRARAFSKTNKAADALALLKDMDEDQDLIRLRADIAWNSSQWEEAAEAFQDLIVEENISSTRPMNEYQANLVLNRSIALNLAGNRVGLANLKERYGDLMMQSDKARLFDLVTRPRKLGMLGNKESVSSLISEVDLFGEFLESYKKIN